MWYAVGFFLFIVLVMAILIYMSSVELGDRMKHIRKAFCTHTTVDELGIIRYICGSCGETYSYAENIIKRIHRERAL